MADGDAARPGGIAIEALLPAVAHVLRDAVGRFGALSGHLTDRVLASAKAEDHALIVALQDFDRLQQEFAALGDVLSHCVSHVSGAARCADAAADPIAGIPLADLKAVLLARARNETIFLATQPRGGSEAVF